MSNTPASRQQNTVRYIVFLVVTVIVVAIAIANRSMLIQKMNEFRGDAHKSSVTSNQPSQSKKRYFELVSEKPETFRVIEKEAANLKIEVYTVESDPPSNKLRLQGTLTFDPNRFVRVHSRFPGEVRRVGPASGTKRPLQYGDKVAVGDLLATIWSKDIGEKKSELVDALSRVHFDKVVLDRLHSATDIVSKRTITDAERIYQGDMVAVAKAERTLRSWNFAETEIEAVRQEARDIIELINKMKSPDHVSENDHSMVQAIIADDGHWAELDVFAAQSGVIVEKNFNVGDIVDTSNVLLKIADINRLQVLANVFEEDVHALHELPKDKRNWRLEVKSDSYDKKPIEGMFDQIGIIVDSNMHTLPVMGYIDNSQQRLAIGQFVTATIDTPGDPNQVVVPVSAVVEEGSKSTVFVETNHEPREYTRRKIAVTQRGRTHLRVSSKLEPHQIDQGIQPLQPGERILINSVVELDAELNDLISSAPKRSTGSQ